MGNGGKVKNMEQVRLQDQMGFFAEKETGFKAFSKVKVKIDFYLDLYHKIYIIFLLNNIRAS